MRFVLTKVILVVLSLGLIPISFFNLVALAESSVCADGSSCPEAGEPTDEELEDSCSDEAETI